MHTPPKKASFLCKEQGLPGQERTCAPRKTRKEPAGWFCTFPLLFLPHSTPAMRAPLLFPPRTKHFPPPRLCQGWSLGLEIPSSRSPCLSLAEEAPPATPDLPVLVGPLYPLTAHGFSFHALSQLNCTFICLLTCWFSPCHLSPTGSSVSWHLP